MKNAKRWRWGGCIIYRSTTPPIGAHHIEVPGRLQEAIVVGANNCGEGREDNFELELMVLFGDGTRYLP